jgi:ssDNA-binding replication factor A large subunit
MFSLEEIVEKICEHTGMTQKKVMQLIDEKEDELSGLVSREGAAYIVARELGISLLRESKKQLKIKSLTEGLNSVDIVARVVNISEPRNFDKDGRKGSVANLILGDETGMVRLSLWNEEIEELAELGVKEGDVVKVSRGYVKMDNRGNLDLRIGKGRMERVEEEVKLPELKGMERDYGTVRRKTLSEAKDGETIETRACLVQLFRKNPFFEVCSTCGVRMKNRGGKWVCDQHGEVKPDYHVVISGVLDDGYGNIRVVFFRELAEKLFGKTASELRAFAQERVDPLAIYEAFDLLGKDYVIKGRLRKNELTENLEMIANSIEEPDAKREFDLLLKEIS